MVPNYNSTTIATTLRLDCLCRSKLKCPSQFSRTQGNIQTFLFCPVQTNTTTKRATSVFVFRVKLKSFNLRVCPVILKRSTVAEHVLMQPSAPPPTVQTDKRKLICVYVYVAVRKYLYWLMLIVFVTIMKCTFLAFTWWVTKSCFCTDWYKINRLVLFHRCSSQRAKAAVLSFLPILSWLPCYPVKQYLLSDVVSGLSTAVVQLPQGQWPANPSTPTLLYRLHELC